MAPLLGPSLEGRGDERFWTRVGRRSPRRVLELGCGTGRITDRLAWGAERVVGLDVSRALLRRARDHLAERPNVSLLAGDMRRVPVRGRFDLVAAANDPFAHLVSGRDRNAALREVALHLTPGGRFLLDALWLEPDRLRAAASPRGWSRERDRSGEGGDLRVTERWRCDPETRCCTVRYRYERGGRPLVRAGFRARCWTLPEARSRFRRAGLRLRRAWGDYDGTPWEEDGASALVLEGVPFAEGPR